METKLTFETSVYFIAVHPGVSHYVEQKQIITN
jgi:hypothetical protein